MFVMLITICSFSSLPMLKGHSSANKDSDWTDILFLCLSPLCILTQLKIQLLHVYCDTLPSFRNMVALFQTWLPLHSAESPFHYRHLYISPHTDFDNCTFCNISISAKHNLFFFQSELVTLNKKSVLFL